jgi:hypothetical protein
MDLLPRLQVFPGQSLIVRTFNAVGQNGNIDDSPNHQFELEVPCYCPTAAAVHEWSQGVEGKATGSEVFIVEDGGEGARRQNIKDLAPSGGGISLVTSATLVRSIITVFQSYSLIVSVFAYLSLGVNGVFATFWERPRDSIQRAL